MTSYLYLHLETTLLDSQEYLTGIGMVEIQGHDIIDQFSTYIYPHGIHIQDLKPRDRQKIHRLAPKFESIAKRLMESIQGKTLITLHQGNSGVDAFNTCWVELGVPLFDIINLAPLLLYHTETKTIDEMASKVQLIHFDSAKEINDSTLQHCQLLQLLLTKYKLENALNTTQQSNWLKQIQYTKALPAFYSLSSPTHEDFLIHGACSELSNELLKYHHAILDININELKVDYLYTGSYYLAEILRLEQHEACNSIMSIDTTWNEEIVVLHGNPYNEYTAIYLSNGIVLGYAMGNSLALLSKKDTLRNMLIDIKTNAHIQEYMGTLYTKKLNRMRVV